MATPVQRETPEGRGTETEHTDRGRDGGLPAIRVEGLTKVYGQGAEAVRAVDELDLTVERGTVVGILGPNGAGKTTAIKSMLGLVDPTDGHVEIAGVDVRENPRDVYRLVGAMLEGARNVYWRLTVRENLRFFAALGGQDPDALTNRHRALLAQLNLAEKADVPVNDLSRGMKQKVSLACTLARQTRVAFLDEPTLGLDVESSIELRRELRRLVRDREMTIVLSSHDLDVIEALCDRVVILSDGQVIADDEVESLIDVFRTEAYEVSVDTLSPSIEQGLDEQFGLTDVKEVGGQVTIELNLDDTTTFYDFIDALRVHDLDIRSVNSVDPDLEDVFIEMTNGTTNVAEGDT